MTESILVCEGPVGGLDQRVLDKMVVQKFSLSVDLVPACGDASLNSVAEHYRELSRPLLSDGAYGDYTVRVLTIEDRNYRIREQASNSWKLGKGHLIWRRHEIENYLLDPRLIADALGTLRTSVRRWPKSLPTMPIQADSLMAQLARAMVEHYAGWVTYWQLAQHRYGLADAGLRRPSHADLQPARYPNRQSWLDFLHTECARVRDDCRKLGSPETLNDVFVDQTYEANLAEATSAEFWTSGRYIEDMGGHELMSALLDHLNQSGLPISQGLLESDLLEALDRIYAPGFYPVDDFAELASRLG